VRVASQVLVETRPGAEPLTLDGAEEIARSALEHRGTPVASVPRFLELPMNYYDSFAFDAIIDA